MWKSGTRYLLSVSVLKYVKELLGPEKAFSGDDFKAMNEGQKSSGSAGSEDFTYISQKIPSIMLAMVAGKPENGYVYPQHHPMVNLMSVL